MSGSARRGVVASIALVVLVWTVIVAIVFLIWVYRAMAVARGLLPSLTISPGWAVGWFFVPIASLWMPYGVMSEIVDGSGISAPAYAQQTRPLIGWWWACWIGRGVVGTLSGFMGVTENGIAILTNGQVVLLVVSSVIGIGAAVLLATIIRRVIRMQASAVDAGIFA